MRHGETSFFPPHSPSKTGVNALMASGGGSPYFPPITA
jgi:hypothetical protein